MDLKMQLQQSCSPRSMYSLATVVGVSRKLIVPIVIGQKARD